MKLLNSKIIIIVALSLLMGGSTYYFYKQNKKNIAKLELAVNNTKAYSNELREIKGENIQFKFTIDQLKYFNDSINYKLLNVAEELKIKNNQVTQLQYLLSISSRVDTIEIMQHDTIFVNEKVNLDTIIGDKWYTLKLGLRFPNKIITAPKFRSEKTIITYDKREYVDPPKKFFLCRWFQKKHTVRHVEVHEESPYVNDTVQRFIEIVK